MSEVLESLRGGLVVSVQGFPEIAAMARAAEAGGAAGIRAQEIAAVKGAVGLPVIGLRKRHVEDSAVYITPTIEDARAVAAAGADIVAVDATLRPRRGGVSAERFLAELVRELPQPILADVDSLEAGLAAREAGAAAVATTLAGYTGGAAATDGSHGGGVPPAASPALRHAAPDSAPAAASPALRHAAPDSAPAAAPTADSHGGGSASAGPDLDLVEALASALDCPVFAEGRIATPEQASAAFDAGAFAVVVGTAITDPVALTRRFAATGRRSAHAAR